MEMGIGYMLDPARYVVAGDVNGLYLDPAWHIVASDGRWLYAGRSLAHSCW